MNKLILCLLVLFSVSLYAQDDVLELDEAGVEVNPSEIQNPDSNVPDEAIEETNTTAVEEPTAEAVEQAKNEAIEEPKSEIVAPIEEVTLPATIAPTNVQRPALITEADVSKPKFYTDRKNRWVASFAFEELKYETVFSFSGKKDFKPQDKELWGGRMSLGGEIYLGGGFIARSMVEGYYVGTLFSRVLNGGAQDSEVKFAYTKQTGQVLGVDTAQSIGWMFDFKTKNPIMEEWSYLTVEPFVEAGIGKAWAYNRLNYAYDLSSTNEAYQLKVRDDLLNARVGAGINMTSRQGFFLSMKVTINRYDITQRKSEGFSKENGQAAQSLDGTDKHAKIDPVTIYSMGGGYKF